MADVVELGVKVTMENGQAVAQGLDRIADSGDKAEASTKRFIGATDGLTASQRFLRDQGLQLDTVLGAVDGSLQKTTEQTLQVTDSTRQMTLTQARAIEMNEAFNGRFVESRAILAAHAQALEMDAAAMTADTAATVENAAAHGVHGLQLGRVNMELGTAIGRFTGMNTAATRFVAMLGGAVGGYGIMIGISIAVVAAAKAYEALTKSTREAQEAQDKATESLKKWYEAKRNGEAAERSNEVEKTKALIDQQQKHLDDERAKLASPTANRSEDVETEIKADIARTVKLMQEERNQIAAGRQDIDKTWEDSFTRERDSQAGALAARLKFNQQDASARTQALALLKQDQALYAQYIKLPETADNSARIAEYAKQIKTLDDALNPKEKAFKVDPQPAIEVNALTDALEKQLDAWRKVNATDMDAMRISQQNTELAKVQGYAHEYLAIQYKAENDTVQALRTEVGAALTERLATINAVRLQSEETLRQTAATKALADGMAILNGYHLKATPLIADQTKEYRNLSSAIEHDMLNAISQFTTRGITSFRSFFQELESLSLRMVGQMDTALAQLAESLKRASAANDSTLKKSIQDDIEKIKELQKLAGGAGAGLAGASAGYAIGSQSGNSAVGALGGAAAGALAGNAILPGIGALVGGLAGLTAGLFGAHDAAKKAAAALEEARKAEEDRANAIHKQFDDERRKKAFDDAVALQDLAVQRARAAGDETLAHQMENENAIRDAMIAGRDADYIAMLKETQALDDATAARQKEAEAAAKALASMRATQDYNVRAIRAGGDTAGADDAAFRFAQQREVEDAIKNGINATALQALYTAQAAEAIKHEIDKQTAIMEGQLSAAQAQLQTAQQTLNATTQLHDSLASFGQSLRSSSLSPADALAAAKAERDRLYGLAQGGDQGAAGKFEQAVTNVLNLSKGYNASGAGFQSDLSDSQRMVDNLTAKFGEQESLQQQIVNTLTNAVSLMQAQLDVLKEGNVQSAAQRTAMITTIQQQRDDALKPNGALIDQFNALLSGENANADAQIGAINASAQAMIDATVALRDHALEPADTLLAALDKIRYSTDANGYLLRTAIDSHGVSVVEAEMASISENRNAVATAAANQIAAIQAGASAAEIAKLAQIAQLERNRLAANADAATQIDQLAHTAGATEYQVVQMENLRAEANDAAKVQIATLAATTATQVGALTGVGRDIVLSQRDILVGNMNAVNAATQAETDAINRGAGAQERAALEGVRVMNLQKSSVDDGFAKQIAEMGQKLGFSSPVVEQLVTQQQEYDAGVNKQLQLMVLQAQIAAATTKALTGTSYIVGTANDPNFVNGWHPSTQQDWDYAISHGGFGPPSSATSSGSTSSASSAASATSNMTVAQLSELITQQKATLAVLQDGLSRMVDAQAETTATVEDGMLILRRQLEAVAS